ncbi:MAG: hypothetical protein KAU27_04380, partial [Desulfuromonadales bacterium]|nr:hypothetical protein [Desulfuromonadales bacterium]
DVSLEPGQYVNAGQTLFEAHGTAVAEIQAQILGNQLRHIVDQSPGPDQSAYADTGLEEMRKLKNLKAIVHLHSGNWNVSWEARFDRIRETIDPQTRAFNVIVAVDNPYEKVIVGKRPPLTRGLFCEVELQGQIRPNSIIIPRAALRNGTVYIVDAESRLQPVKVASAFTQGDLVVIASGLVGGETLVVSDPAPAVTGTLITPIRDSSLEARLLAEANAETELK